MDHIKYDVSDALGKAKNTVGVVVYCTKKRFWDSHIKARPMFTRPEPVVYA